MSADPERVRDILDELIQQRARLAAGSPLLAANGRAIAYWRSQRDAARRVADREPGYTAQRSRM